jgi:hypothetical protein
VSQLRFPSVDPVRVVPLSHLTGSTRLQAQSGSRVLPRCAAALVLAFVLTVWAGVLVRENLPGAERILGQGIGSTGAVFITPLALVAAVGLWLRTGWGWWFSLIVGGYQATSYLLFLMVVIASGDRTGVLTWGSGSVLVAFLTVLLLPGTRVACTAPEPEHPSPN